MKIPQMIGFCVFMGISINVVPVIAGRREKSPARFAGGLIAFLTFAYVLTVLVSMTGIKGIFSKFEEIEPGLNAALQGAGVRDYKIVTGMKFKSKFSTPPDGASACQFVPFWMWIDIVSVDSEVGAVAAAPAQGHSAVLPSSREEVPKSSHLGTGLPPRAMPPPEAKPSWGESEASATFDTSSTFSSGGTFGGSTFAPTKFES